MDGRCGHCGFDNDPWAKFCASCGRALGQDDAVTHPRFITGNQGRPYCAAHTDFDGRRITEYDDEQLVRPLRAHSLACNRCEHYCKDECYFSATSIDGITRDIFKRRMWCDLCAGWYLVSPVVVLQKIYWEQTSGGKGYITCPNCDRLLKTGHNSPTRYSILMGLIFPLFLIPILFLITLYAPVPPEMFLLLGLILTFALYKYTPILAAYPKKRHNLKECQRALEKGAHPQLFLAVD